jgi:hypothetical protein
MHVISDDTVTNGSLHTYRSTTQACQALPLVQLDANMLSAL